jgi:hypothetical protein
MIAQSGVQAAVVQPGLAYRDLRRANIERGFHLSLSSNGNHALDVHLEAHRILNCHRAQDFGLQSLTER